MDYRKLTRLLIARVRELQRDVADCYESLDYMEARHGRSQRSLRADLDRLEGEMERERNESYRRQYERADALGDLERARRYDDPYAESRALDRLKRL